MRQACLIAPFAELVAKPATLKGLPKSVSKYVVSPVSVASMTARSSGSTGITSRFGSASRAVGALSNEEPQHTAADHRRADPVFAQENIGRSAFRVLYLTPDPLTVTEAAPPLPMPQAVQAEKPAIKSTTVIAGAVSVAAGAASVADQINQITPIITTVGN